MARVVVIFIILLKPSSLPLYLPLPEDAVLYAVGKPVFHKAVPDKSYGAWMKDPFPANNEQAEKIWVTREDVDDNLYEYANKEDFRKNSMPRLLRLNPKLQVSGYPR